MTRNTLLILTIIIASCSCDQLKSRNVEPEEFKKAIKQNQGIEPCSCYNGIGAVEGDSSIYSLSFSTGQEIIVCGLKTTISYCGKPVFSEFNVYQCNSSQSLAEYSAMDNCLLTSRGDTFVIQNVNFIPVGDSWSWQCVPMAEQYFTPVRDSIVATELNPIKLELPDINPDSVNQFLQQIRDAKSNYSSWEEELGRLETLSLMGSDEAFELLKDYNKYIDGELDGALAEQWKNAIATVEWVTRLN